MVIQMDILDKGKQYLSPVMGHYTELEVLSAKGVWVKTAQGRSYLDFTSGVAVTNTGHNHPVVVQAIKDQADQLIHISSGVAYCKPNVDLAEKLVKITGYTDGSVFFCQSGTEAIEASIKLVRYVSKKAKILTYTLAFHGRTLGSLSMTYKEKFRHGYENWLIKDVERLPYPYCYRCPYAKKYGDCGFECLKALKTLLLADDQIGGVLIEPILGEGGYVPAPVEYIQELRRFTAERGIVLVFDEIQTGFGRTGMMFAKELYDVQPDVMALAKGIASGMPLGACVASGDLMKQWTTSAHGGTFLGNTLCCAAGLATLRVIESEKLLENTYHVGQYIKGLLLEAKQRYPVIGDIRGAGLMIGVEFVKPGTLLPNPELVATLRQVAQDRGLLLLSCGEEGQVIRLIPPLIMTKEEAAQGINILLDIIRENK